MEVAVLFKLRKNGIDGDLLSPELTSLCPTSFVPPLIY